MNGSIASREALWTGFLERWPLQNLSTMTLEQYSKPGGQDVFTYWLEKKTEDIGSIWGGSSFKFGVYVRKDKTPQESVRGKRYDETYGWMEKYGQTPQDAFEKVRAEIVKVARAAREGRLSEIDAARLGDAVKWKIAFLYQDRDNPSIFPIFKAEYLRVALDSGEKRISKLHLELMGAREGKNLLVYGDEVWTRIQPLIKTALTPQQAQVFLERSSRFRLIKKPTQYIAGFESAEGQQVALARDNAKTTLYLGDGPWLDDVRTLLQEVVFYPADKSRGSNLAANAPKLAVGNPIVKVVVPTMEALIALCDAYTETEEAMFDEAIALASLSLNAAPPLNQILFGPPGTGKTYATIDAALQVLDPAFLEANWRDRAKLKQRFDALADEGRIRFVTFHQSFSYEDFIEGLRAEPGADGLLRYLVVDGVFKAICDPSESTGDRRRVPFQIGEQFGGGYRVLTASDEVVELQKLRGKRLPLPICLLRELADLVATGELTVDDIREKRVFDKLPDSTTLEPFLVNGYCNVLPHLIEKMVATHNEEIVEHAEPVGAPRVLIIDEINRGNVSRIFGELITLIEPSKRAGRSEALEVTLPYSKKKFSVPDNVHIIGTMNTADRSIAGLDIALRRRFEFVEMPPRPDLLDDIDVEGVNVGQLLRVMNARIEVLLDRDHSLGHAYFMPLIYERKLPVLARIFRNNVLPLLQEYFFEDWQRIAWVLNDHRKPQAHRFLVEPANDLVELFGHDLGVPIQARRWMLNVEAFSRVEAYFGIITSAGASQA